RWNECPHSGKSHWRWSCWIPCSRSDSPPRSCPDKSDKTYLQTPDNRSWSHRSAAPDGYNNTRTLRSPIRSETPEYIPDSAESAYPDGHPLSDNHYPQKNF